jgi:Asparagine synthase (glutamine-hydrolyzing)
MCGIAGIWYKKEQQNGWTTIKKMTDVIAHRGPDGEGHETLAEGSLFFGHRRLSIIDLSNAGKGIL